VSTGGRGGSGLAGAGAVGACAGFSGSIFFAGVGAIDFDAGAIEGLVGAVLCCWVVELAAGTFFCFTSCGGADCAKAVRLCNATARMRPIFN